MNTSPQTPGISNPERLAYWYFRLNGFLTTENFIVHPDSGSNQRTDADIIAVRFAHRAENLAKPMPDDPIVAECSTLVNVIIAEVKTGCCALNGPWTAPASENLRRVLSAIGCVDADSIGPGCEALYATGSWSDSVVTIRLFAIGEARDPSLPIPAEQQLTWDEILRFCSERFQAYAREKSSVGQWSRDGKKLMNLAKRRNYDRGAIRRAFGLNEGSSPTSGGI